MTHIFLTLLNMSITAGWIVLAVILLRFFLRKAPKWISCLLWGLVALRLVLPFSIESVLSLIPSKETIPPEIVHSSAPTIHSGIELFNSTLNPVISHTLAPDPVKETNPVQTILSVASIVWISGIAIMLIYTIVSFLRVRMKVGASIRTDKNIFICDEIDTPFILGVIKPRIYLPSTLSKTDAQYVVAHEKAHLKRKDHLWKPFGFLLLSIYWFNPLLWVGYILLCRDIELACDEKVVKDFEIASKKDYSTALLNCSIPRKMISACPLAFGEVGVKARIKNVLSYKKPALWIICIALIACIVASVCLLTNPVSKNEDNFLMVHHYTDREGISIDILSIDTDGKDPYIEIKWNNTSDYPITANPEYRIYDPSSPNDRNEEMYVRKEPACEIPKKSSVTMKYSLKGIEFEDNTKYCFEAFFSSGMEVAGVEFYYNPDSTEVSTQETSSLISGNAVYLHQVPQEGTKTLDGDSVLTIVWQNNTTETLETFSENFHIYKMTSEGYTNHRKQDVYYYTMSPVSLPASLDTAINYPLNGVGYLDDGKYRLEADFVGESGKKYTAQIEFTVGNGNIKSETNLPLTDEPCSVYSCPDSRETVLPPQLMLYPEGRRFELHISGLSSYIATGTFRTEGDIMTLTGELGDTYTFKVIDSDNLKFLADKSTELPKYSYSANDAPRYPFEDGAIFMREQAEGDTSNLVGNNTESTTGIEHTIAYAQEHLIDSTLFDLDGDGVNEKIILGDGGTYGLSTMTIAAFKAEYYEFVEDGYLNKFSDEAAYFNHYHMEPFYSNLSFLAYPDKGKLYLQGYKDDGTPVRLEVFYLAGRIIIADNGLGYGLTPSYARFDIDSDGVEEDCLLSYMASLYATLYLDVYENGRKEYSHPLLHIESYENTYYSYFEKTSSALYLITDAVEDDYEAELTELRITDGEVEMIPAPTVYDTAVYDIDEDGVKEDIYITNENLTSGLFTFTVTAYENGEIEYKNTFQSEWLDLSFTENEGKLRITGITQDKTDYKLFYVSLIAERIVLTESGGERLPYWGDELLIIY